MTAEEAFSSSSAAAAAVGSDNYNEDALTARKLFAIQQLTDVFGFPYAAAEQAVDYFVETSMKTSGTAAVTTTTTNGITSDDPTVAAPLTSALPPIDITECCNYILDAGLAQDQGGPIAPIENCPHVINHCRVTVSQLPLQPSFAPCTEVSKPSPPLGNLKSDTAYGDAEQDGNGVMCQANENWLCLECGVVRCSRYCNGHALQHWEDTKIAETAQQQQQNSRSDIDEVELNRVDVISVPAEGHCIAASLSDLSVWCHVCKSYLSTSTGSTGRAILSPLIQQLEHYKFDMENTPTIVLQEPSSKKLKHDGYSGSSDPGSVVDAAEENHTEERGTYFLLKGIDVSGGGNLQICVIDPSISLYVKYSGCSMQ
jgi:Zn-finger in ubiquitin-hydrolases and other protein